MNDIDVSCVIAQFEYWIILQHTFMIKSNLTDSSARIIEELGIYETRLLVFMETDPQSNRYCQVLLNPDEFKKLSLSLGTTIGKDGDEDIVELKLSEVEYKLPDLQSKTRTTNDVSENL